MEPTDQQKAFAEAQKRIIDRIAELNSLEGKCYVENGKTSPIVRVLGYGGTAVKNGIEFYTLLVTSDGARWRPIARDFLQNYSEVEATAKAAIQNEPV